MWAKRDGEVIIIIVGKEANCLAGENFSEFAVIGSHKSQYK